MEKSIKSKSKGTLFFLDEYVSYGATKAIQKSLERLADKQVIVKVAQGIYVRPKISKLIGTLVPTSEEVAEAFSKLN